MIAKSTVYRKELLNQLANGNIMITEIQKSQPCFRKQIRFSAHKLAVNHQVVSRMGKIAARVWILLRKAKFVPFLATKGTC